MSETEPKQAKRKHATPYVNFSGLHAQLRSPNSRHYLKSMLVSHAFVDLWREIAEDKTFNKSLFDRLDESERDFMRFCLNRSKVASREFDSAYNSLLDKHVNRLKMLQGAIAIGDDNPSIKTEINSILDLLYQKGVFSRAYYGQFKKAMNRSIAN